MDKLHQLAPFLSSAFVRIPPPALGPLAFKRFWDSTYQGVGSTPRNYPESIKCCLRAYHEVYGGDPPTGITMGSQNSTEGTDSQPSFDPSRIVPTGFASKPRSNEPKEDKAGGAHIFRDITMPDETRSSHDTPRDTRNPSLHSEIPNQDKNEISHNTNTRQPHSFIRAAIRGLRSPSPPSSPTDRCRSRGMQSVLIPMKQMVIS